MWEIVAMLARAGAGVFNWIANLGPYSWNEVMLAIVFVLSVVLALVIAFYLAARRNRAIEFVDQSEVLTSPLRNRAEPQFIATRQRAETDGNSPARLFNAPPLTDAAAAARSKPRPQSPVPAPAKANPIRAQLVLEPLSAGSGNVAEIAQANAITQRLKIVLAALAPHIAVERKAEAFGATSTLERYILTGGVRHMGDRVRLQIEMTDAKTGASLFRFRYQGLPKEQDVMLAEITSRVLKAATHSASHKKDAA